MSFVSHNKQLIPFASSFGHNTYGGDYYNRIYNTYCLKRFDSISVREKDAIGLMKEKFNIENVEQVIEPVFTLDYEEWDKIIADSFHGTCFSIVFKKQFISFLNKGRGESRYALFEELKQKDRIINNLDELKNKKDLFDKIDYTETFEIIK